MTDAERRDYNELMLYCFGYGQVACALAFFIGQTNPDGMALANELELGMTEELLQGLVP